MPSTSTDIRIISEDQSIWASGDRVGLEWSEYFPILGGGRSTYELSKVRFLEGGGRVIIDGETLNWEPPAWYATIANGVVRTVVIAYDMTDENGVTTTRTLAIKAIGTALGTAYEIPGLDDGFFGPYEFIHTSGSSATGVTEDKGPTSTSVTPLPENGIIQLDVITARDILRDGHQFETMVPIDIDWDLMAGIHDLAAAATSGLANAEAAARADALAARAAWEVASENAGLVNAVLLADAEILATRTARDAAKVTYDGAVVLQNAWQDARIEETAAIAAQTVAQGAFDTASSLLSAAQTSLNAAKNTLASVTSSITSFLGGIAYGSLDAIIIANNVCDICVPDGLVNTARSLQSQLSSAQSAVNSWTSTVASRQISFNSAQSALNEAKGDVSAAVAATFEALNDLNDYLAGQSVSGLYSLYQLAANAYNEALADRLDALNAMWANGILQFQAPTAADLVYYNAIAADRLADKIWYDDLLEEAIGLVNDAANILADALTSTEIQLQARVEVDVDAQVGFQVKMTLDAGSVDSALDYRVDTQAELDELADTFTVTAVATNTNGDTVAFETISPNATFYAGFVYDIGAQFRILVDLFSQIAGLEVFDFPNGPNPLQLTETIRMAGWIDLIDFDTRDLSYSPDLPGWVGDILGFNFTFPTIETFGRAADISADVYTDPAGFDLDRLADVLLDFVNAKLDYSDEFRALLIQEGAYSDLTTNDFGEAFVTALSIFFDLLTGEGDTDGDGVVPLFTLKNDAGTVDGLFHINSIADVIGEVDIENAGSLGFFVAEGQSDNVIEVTVDIDQLAAVLVNLAFGIPPNAAVNPLDLGIGIEDILEKVNISDEMKAAIADFIRLDLGFEAMDLDVSTGANFSQKFALSVDDMVFDLEFEDGTTRQVRASEGGEIVIENASSLVDTNGNGSIDYTMTLTPDATFFNDTQIGLNIGYTLDFLKANFEAFAKLPLNDIFGGLSLPGVPEEVGIALGLGPVVRMEGDLNLLSMDIFEDIFDFDAGNSAFAGAFTPAAGAEGINYTAGDSGEDFAGTQYADTLTGGTGADTIGGRSGDDWIGGGDGDDAAYGNLGNDTLRGGTGDDLLNGGNGSDNVAGEAGDDTVFGGQGADMLFGGVGDDRVIGGNGRDLAYMGGGNDTFIDNGQGGANGRDTVFGGAGNDTMQGGNGDDVLYGEAGFDVIYGRLGDDRIYGGDKKDILFGGDGNDTVFGGEGRDRVYLGNGDDVFFDSDDVTFGDDFIFGAGGNDTIRMGGGNDTATGGGGADVFVFAADINADTVTDYAVGQDALQIDAGLWGGALNQARIDTLSSVSGGNLVLDFGGGHSITFTGVTSNTGMIDDITLL
ncbi:hypothetical protein [Thetidibacter halocola]|uniref:Calcium-binding protein n=1 Tax=Thetidibacter halocola TaxID=2827239 RepID=A0A8J7WGQ2_9RHOB|nr:hypothetical protein [Thetidibacter halocola]MBS0125003.1 hypothetical protein [Thetidibacter halocola]